MAERLGLPVLAVPFKLARQLENKLVLAELAAAADARIPDTVTVRLDDDLARAALADGIALPRVFQPAVSFAGVAVGAGGVYAHATLATGGALPGAGPSSTK
jgi:glutathione synthase/RimK-type ligase-like ATP-grasp enzyme